MAEGSRERGGEKEEAEEEGGVKRRRRRGAWEKGMIVKGEAGGGGDWEVEEELKEEEEEKDGGMGEVGERPLMSARIRHHLSTRMYCIGCVHLLFTTNKKKRLLAIFTTGFQISNLSESANECEMNGWH